MPILSHQVNMHPFVKEVVFPGDELGIVQVFFLPVGSINNLHNRFRFKKRVAESD